MILSFITIADENSHLSNLTRVIVKDRSATPGQSQSRSNTLRPGATVNITFTFLSYPSRDCLQATAFERQLHFELGRNIF